MASWKGNGVAAGEPGRHRSAAAPGRPTV